MSTRVICKDSAVDADEEYIIYIYVYTIYGVCHAFFCLRLSTRILLPYVKRE